MNDEWIVFSNHILYCMNTGDDMAIDNTLTLTKFTFFCFIPRPPPRPSVVSSRKRAKTFLYSPGFVSWSPLSHVEVDSSTHSHSGKVIHRSIQSIDHVYRLHTTTLQVGLQVVLWSSKQSGPGVRVLASTN